LDSHVSIEYFVLNAKANFMEGKFETKDFALREKLFTDAVDFLVTAAKKDAQHPEHQQITLDFLQEVLGYLVGTRKHRKKQGKSLYHMLCTFLKEGLKVKNWKSRIFVIDDNAISYYKDKKVYELEKRKGI